MPEIGAGMREIQKISEGMQGIRLGMREIGIEMQRMRMGMRVIRVELIRVEMREMRE